MIKYLTVSDEDLANDEELSIITNNYKVLKLDFNSVRTCSFFFYDSFDTVSQYSIISNYFYLNL